MAIKQAVRCLRSLASILRCSRRANGTPGIQQKLLSAPEHGGDGGHAVGPCAHKQGPVAL
jgi:hypothetical protein